MKRQTVRVQKLQAKIASMINLVKLGIKKYVVRLIELETALEQAVEEQLTKVIKPMTWTITATMRRQEGKKWVAMLTGLCPTYTFKRVFIHTNNIEWGKYGMKKAVFTITEPGYYQDSDGDYFRVFVDGDSLDYCECSWLEIKTVLGAA